MRIGIEAQRITRDKKHGMEVVAIENIKALQQLDQANEYFVFVRRGPDKNVIQPSTTTQIFSIDAFNFVDWEQNRLPKIAKKMNLDLLHCTSNTGPLWYNGTMVLTLHDIIYLENLNFKGTAYQNFGNLYRRLVVPRLVKKCDLILTVSNYEKHRIVEHLKLPDDLVQVNYNGVNPIFTLPVEKKKIEGLPEHYILFFGNTAPKKNTLNVLKAYQTYINQVRDPLPIVITDLNKDILASIMRKNDIQIDEKFIHPTGYINYNSLPTYYQNASIFLYPSLRESFGMPIIEAMASGAPVITSNTSSMPEIAGDAAYLVDPFKPNEISDGIVRFQSDNDYRKLKIEKGIDRAKLFSWNESARKLLGFYNEVVQ